MNRILTAATGLAAVGLSTAAIVLTAAHRSDGYSHYTKAISELGSPEAVGAGWFNALGYIGPGLLIAVLAWKLRGCVSTSHPVAFQLLALSGLGMTLAGVVPIDLNFRTSPAALVHTVGSLGSGLAWLGCALTLRRSLRPDVRWAPLARWLPWLPLLVAGLMLLVPSGMPEIQQRLSFGGYFLFITGLACWLWRLPQRPVAGQPGPATKTATGPAQRMETLPQRKCSPPEAVSIFVEPASQWQE